MFGEDLLTARESVAATHAMNYGAEWRVGANLSFIRVRAKFAYSSRVVTLRSHRTCRLETSVEAIRYGCTFE